MYKITTKDYEEIFIALEDAKNYIITSNHFLYKIQNRLSDAVLHGASLDDLCSKIKDIRLELANAYQTIAQKQMAGKLKERSDKNETTIQN